MAEAQELPHEEASDPNPTETDEKGGEKPTDMLLLKKAEQRRQRDLYTALNLEEGASNDEVRGAYLRLAALMHPDKHGGGSALRADAEEQFRRIDRAYKVLTDPLMRQAYDLYGERGLRLLQALPQHELLPLRFPVEVAYLLEELSAEEAQYSALSAQSSQGAVTVDVAMIPPTRFPRLRQLTVEQQVEVPITGALKAFGGIYVVTRKAAGFGMGYVGGRFEVAKGTHLNCTYVMSQKNKLTVETARELSPSLSVRASLALPEGGSPALKLASSRRLSKTLTGTVDLSAALDGDEEAESLGLSLTSATGKTELTGKVRVAGEELALRGSYENRISHTVHLSFAAKVGNRGLDASLNGTRTLSSLVAVTFGVKVALDGVTVTTRLRKGRQQLVLPIRISARMDPWSALLGGVVGCGLNAVLSFALRPFERVRVQRRLRLLEQQATRQQAVERRHAAAQVRLMAATAAKKREAEQAGGGLVILEAYYGTTLPAAAAVPSSSSSSSSASASGSAGSKPEPDWFAPGREEDRALDLAPAIDVRIPLQFFVAKGRLYLPPGSKAGVLGFYDVAANPTWLLAASSPSSSDPSDAAYAATTSTTMGRRLRPAPSFLAPIRPPGPPPRKHHQQQQPGQHARLYVRYANRGRVYEVTVDDIQPLELPPMDGEHTELGAVGAVA